MIGGGGECGDGGGGWGGDDVGRGVVGGYGGGDDVGHVRLRRLSNLFLVVSLSQEIDSSKISGVNIDFRTSCLLSYSGPFCDLFCNSCFVFLFLLFSWFVFINLYYDL